ncbi:MAG: hypothetical protein ACXVQQ_01130 [Gaiellaceae bacterium]
MRAVRRVLLTVVAVGAGALVFAAGGPAASGGGSFPVWVETTSYPWVQPPPGTGVTGPQGTVAQQVCTSVQLPCTIPLK